MKKKVRMNVSIAGFGDANPSELAARYAKQERKMRAAIRRTNNMEIRVYTEEQIAAEIRRMKADDEAQPRRGFSRDFSFKMNDEPVIDAAIAEKWEESGICTILSQVDAQKKAA